TVARLAHQRREPPVEGHLVRYRPPGVPALVRRGGHPVQLRGRPSRRFLQQQRITLLEHARAQLTGRLVGDDQDDRVGMLRLEHGPRVGVAAREAKALAMPRGAVGIEVGAPGQDHPGMPARVERLRRPVRAGGVLATPDHAELHGPGYGPSTDRAPVSTTSKSDPFTRASVSRPWSRRSGAIDMSQSLPLSAMNIPYVLSPFSTACACFGNPLTSKSWRSRKRSPMRGSSRPWCGLA